MSDNKSKKGGCLKWVGIFGILFIAFFIYSIYHVASERSDSEAEHANDSIEVEKHKTMMKDGWDKLPSSTKTDELNKFITSKENFYSNKRFLLNESINTLIKASVKYPETLEYKGISGDYVKDPAGNTSISETDVTITNADKGEFSVSKEFTSENKLSQKVKGLITVDVTFDGLKWKIKNFKVE